MSKKIELLAPGGDTDSIKAAIAAGADAVYCGLDRFNARTRATNITLKDLNGILRLAHKHDCRIFLALNIIVVESETKAFISLLHTLMQTSVDGIILQDLGMFYLVHKHFHSLKIHASTQLTTHNKGQIHFLKQLGATRVNVCRELNIKEVSELTHVAHANTLSTEMFVHGSYCLSFSGLCYLSSVLKGKSGNRGRCSQPCRDRYLTTPQGKKFPLNLKDNSAFFNLREIVAAGVDSVKIEGRIKKFHYVYSVVRSWKEQINRFYRHGTLITDNTVLYKVFNREFSSSFLTGEISKNMFIDNPRDNSAIHLAETKGGATKDNIQAAKRELYDEKTQIIRCVQQKIATFSIEKEPLVITVSGTLGNLLKVDVQTPDTSFTLCSKSELVPANIDNADSRSSSRAIQKTPPYCLGYESFTKIFKPLNETGFYIDAIDLEHLQSNLFIPFKELHAIKKEIICILHGSEETITPPIVPVLIKQDNLPIRPTLSVVISSEKDVHLCGETTAEVCFYIPNCLNGIQTRLVNMFIENKRLIPWFPSILIGKDYDDAIELLQQTQPERIVTNNSGIAYEAFTRGIEWIAGPHFNTVNSYSLLALKKVFNCAGAFVSNEINKDQIRYIKRADDLKLYYSIYHPIMLMTSRQCLLHQVIGCEKESVDEECISGCLKASSIKNVDNVPLFIEKTPGNLHSIYNNENYLNTDIVTDMPNTFSSFSIDLRDITTETHISADKLGTIKLFENLLTGKSAAAEMLARCIHPVTNDQYQRGI